MSLTPFSGRVQRVRGGILPYLARFRRLYLPPGFIVIADALRRSPAGSAGTARRTARRRGDTGRFRLTDRRGSMMPGEGAITGPTFDGRGQR
jgi:hypothetical protein